MRGLLIPLLSMFALMPLLAPAQQGQELSSERAARQRSSLSRDAGSMSAAVRRVERATGGQVLGVETLRFEGREIHRVKVLTPGGRVMVVVDDPASLRVSPRLPEFSPTHRDDTDSL
ncbi:MAG: hypothetical protein Q4B94_00720 [Pseudomonadota bacterium]|nr:hypothetical protein [Pseudomonadota bacterium]